MKTQKTSLHKKRLQGVAKIQPRNTSEILEEFLDYARYELNFSPQTIIKYRDALKSFLRDLGDKPIEEYEVQEFVQLKKQMAERGLSEARIYSVVYAVRSILSYCQNFLGLNVLNPKQIRPPKRSKREVVFLTKEEIQRFIDTINTRTWNGFRFRVLVEVLLGTGMRISEALSLNRKTINWEKKEAKIIGKGNKERTVFFNQRSLDWITKYLEKRNDTHEAIFITRSPINRCSRDDVWRFFDRHRRLAKIDKKLTPHILRHTVATNLVFNGCPITHVKEILGHERLDTPHRQGKSNTFSAGG